MKQIKSNYIVDDIMGKIIKKQYLPKEKIPTEKELMSNYGVSRYKLREALNSLESMNLIHRVQGSGTFVTDQSHINTLIYNSMTKKKYDEILSKVLSFEKIIPTRQVAEMFDIHPDEMIWQFKRMRIADSRISQIEITMMPCSLFPDLTERIVEKSIHTYVTKKGFTISHQITEYGAINSDNELSELMQCKKNTALTTIKNYGYLNDNSIFEISQSYNLDYTCAYITDYSYEVQKRRIKKREAL